VNDPKPNDPCGVCLAPADAPSYPFFGLKKIADLSEGASLVERFRAVGWPDEETCEIQELRLFPEGVPRTSDVPCGHRMLRHLVEHLWFLENRLGTRVQETTPPARDEMLRFVQCWYWRDLVKAAPLTRRVYNEASYQLTLLRDRIRNNATFTDHDRQLLGRCVTCLANSGDPWLITRKLLELLRVAPTPTLDSDLRYWGDRRITEWVSDGSEPEEENREHQRDQEEEEQRKKKLLPKLLEVPEPWSLGEEPFRYSVPPRGNWSTIPEELGFALHHMLGAAQLDDEQLVKFRSQFVEYSVDRLKPGKHFEPDKHWREGYIRAAEALRINPNGKQRVLFQVKDKDPDLDVRREAQRFYSVLRSGPKLDMSPRRACFDAVWELFRAHMKALGEEINETAAAKTRREMIRRTTRSHHERKPKSD